MSKRDLIQALEEFVKDPAAGKENLKRIINEQAEDFAPSDIGLLEEAADAASCFDEELAFKINQIIQSLQGKPAQSNFPKEIFTLIEAFLEGEGTSYLKQGHVTLRDNMTHPEIATDMLKVLMDKMDKECFLDYLKTNGYLINALDLRPFASELYDNDLREIVRCCPSLDKINLSESINLTDEGLGSFRDLKYLRSLDLSMCRISNKGLAHFSDLIFLRELNLWGCVNITGKGLKMLEKLGALESLNLSECAMEDEDFVWIRNFKMIKDLQLMNCNISDEGAASLAFLTQVESLNLAGNPRLTNEALVPLKSLASLRNLKLSGCAMLNDEALECLKGLTCLRFLDLYSCPKITGVGIRFFLEGFEEITVRT